MKLGEGGRRQRAGGVAVPLTSQPCCCLNLIRIPRWHSHSQSHCHFGLAWLRCLSAAAQSLILFKALPDDSLWPKSKTWPIHELRVPVSHLFESNWKLQRKLHETRRRSRRLFVRSSRNLMGGEVRSSCLCLLTNTSTYT